MLAHFGAPKYPKRFVNPAMSLLHNPMRIKKTAALRLISSCLCFFGLIEPFGVCVQYFLKLNHRYEHKTTAFQVC